MEQAPLRVRPAVVLHLSSEHVRGRDMTLPVTLPGTKDCDAVGGAFRPQWREGSLRRLQIVATLPQSAEAALRSRCNDGSGATRSGVPLALSRSLPRGAVRPASVLNSGFCCDLRPLSRLFSARLRAPLPIFAPRPTSPTRPPPAASRRSSGSTYWLRQS